MEIQSHILKDDRDGKRGRNVQYEGYWKHCIEMQPDQVLKINITKYIS